MIDFDHSAPTFREAISPYVTDEELVDAFDNITTLMEEQKSSELAESLQSLLNEPEYLIIMTTLVVMKLKDLKSSIDKRRK